MNIKKIRFVSFVNDDTARTWRKNLEEKFMKDYSTTYKEEYEMLNYLRSILKKERSMEEKIRLLDLKRHMQVKWFVCLNTEVYHKILDFLKAKNVKSDDPVIVVLPEFFWRNINDNNKHIRQDDTYICNYGKPFYKEVKDIWKNTTERDMETLQSLTKQYENLIIFAGTIWWKRFSNAQETIFNSIPIFFSGKFQYQWSKENWSDIDGYGDYELGSRKLSKANKSAKCPGGYKPCEPEELANPILTNIPMIPKAFQGVKISMDICLDFMAGNSHTKKYESLSSVKLGIAEKPDIQILIAGGMPITEQNKGCIYTNKFFLRCDAYSPEKNGQTFSYGSYQIIPGTVQHIPNPEPGHLFRYVELNSDTAEETVLENKGVRPCKEK